VILSWAGAKEALNTNTKTIVTNSKMLLFIFFIFYPFNVDFSMEPPAGEINLSIHLSSESLPFRVS